MYKYAQVDINSNILRTMTHKENTGDKVANFMEGANGLNVIAVAMNNFVALYKFHFPDGKLSLL